MPCTHDVGCKPIDSPHTRWEDATACTDPSHPHFWMPANWPGGRAPAQVEYRHDTPRPDREYDTSERLTSVSARLWVADAAGVPDLWTSAVYGSGRGIYPFDERIRRVFAEGERLAAELEADRDKYLVEQAELEEIQLLMGMPG